MSSRGRARDLDKFPTKQLFFLAIVRLTEPIALTSIFPYSWQLVKRFGVGDERHASFYSGLLIAAFSFTEAITGMLWGSLSDRHGRKPILLCGCAGTVLSMLILGFAQNFWVALAGRAIGGMLNGNIAVIQTMVGELTTRPEHEPRAYSIMPFMWSMGAIIGPAIGGTFADPSTSYPAVFSPSGIFARFPYLLSNLICAGILIIGMITGYFFLEETLIRQQIPKNTCGIIVHIPEEAPLISSLGPKKASFIQTRVKAYGSCETLESGVTWKKEYQTEVVPKILTKRIIGLVIAMGIFSYHSITYDQLLPIYLEDQPARSSIISTISDMVKIQSSGGLGLSVQQVGFIMSIDGLLALVVQALIFPFAAAYFGIQHIFLFVSVLQPITFLVMPYLIYLPSQWLNAGIYFCLSIRNLLSIIAFSAILISLKEATPSTSVLGRVNGLATSVGSACRTVAPPMAGFLYSLGSRYEMVGLVWYTSALVAGIGAIQAFTIKGQGQRADEEWIDEGLPTLVNTPVNSSDDERDGDLTTSSESDSDTGPDNVPKNYERLMITFRPQIS